MAPLLPQLPYGSSTDRLIFPRIAIKQRPGNRVVVREKEKVLDEKVIQRTTEEVPDPVTGKTQLVTVEYVEKLIETEVLQEFEAHTYSQNNHIQTQIFFTRFFLPFCTFSITML